MTETVRFLVVLWALGLAGSPLAARAFPVLPGSGAGFGRVLALLLFGWLFWMVGSLGLGTGFGVVLGCALLVAAAGVWAHALRPAGTPADAFRGRTLVMAEVLFAGAFLLGVLVVAQHPAVWGTEKPMDMAILNAVNTSGSFPPHDPWLSGFDLNYYYLGHLLLALLVRVTDVEPSAGYGLALATVFALSVSVTFALTTTFAETLRRQGLPIRRPRAAGLLGVVLLVLMGNLRGGWDALTNGSLGRTDWFGASRVIPDTINEFPASSFAVGDLHAHLIAVPLTLLAVAFAVQVVAGPEDGRARGGVWTTAAAALATGILYAVNSWSWPVAAGVFAAAIVVRAVLTRENRWRLLAWGAGTLVLGFCLVLPFVLGFEPNAGGIGTVQRDLRQPLGAFLREHAVLEGALLWVTLVPLAALGRRAPKPVGVAMLVAVVVVLGLGGARLGGAAFGLALALAATTVAVTGRRPAAERLLWLVVAAGLALVAVPEVLYVRDEFDGSELARMNTVFKLGYQAWLLLAVAGALLLVSARRWLPPGLRTPWRAVAAVLVAVSSFYPVGAAVTRAREFDGLSLEGRQPPVVPASDRAAINWLRAHVGDDATVAEAVGQDYSTIGAGRISVFTGRPTVLGWAGHELQWSHDPGTRAADVEAVYRATDPAQVRALTARYGIRYAVVGPLELATYGPPAALAQVGRPVFRSGSTTVYAL